MSVDPAAVFGAPDYASSGSGTPSPQLAKAELGTSFSSNSAKKRTSTSTESGAPVKVTKRRAARACVSCRARKVRCDVVEGAPCGNCRWDNVECVVQESRRRKKNTVTANAVGQNQQAEAQQLRCKTSPTTTTATARASNGGDNQGIHHRSSVGSPNVPIASSAADPRRQSSVSSAISPGTMAPQSVEGILGLIPSCVADSHVPHMIYQRSGFRSDLMGQSSIVEANNSTSPSSANLAWPDTSINPNRLFGDVYAAQQPLRHPLSDLATGSAPQLPPFLRPLPSKIAPEDVSYLQAKGALTLPEVPLQNALLKAYAEFVHPYMPLMDLHPFLNIVNSRNGFNGQMSLLLYHAVMFSAAAYVDMKLLREAGFSNRKAARKTFFQKTRLLYDFDYESDRLVLVQSLLLMTYWYETPDDQKDTWHWMGVAISLAHTIGLHRNPGADAMTPAKKKLWKRIWWSCFMRDRLIALGMRRPTRIKDEDFDVPMLLETDFEIQTLADNNTVIPPDCTLLRDVSMQRELALMCISKAKLCLCISQMLKTQYSVLIRDNMKPENTTNSTMMLFPNKTFDNVETVGSIDKELRSWAEQLPAICRYKPLTQSDLSSGRATIAVQRIILHMVHQTTVSALHRPQFLPSSPMQVPTTSRQVQDMSRVKVREAAMQITRMATELHQYKLEKFLPTTGVTVILPAMIIHLLEMKNPSRDSRERAMRGFRQCMRVMEKLREIYSAADYATGFLDAALRKAAINIHAGDGHTSMDVVHKGLPLGISPQTPPPETLLSALNSEALNDASAMDQTLIMLPPNTVNGPALELDNNTPPQTDFTAADLTPSASGVSEETPIDAGADPMDMDFMEGHDEFDWNAVAGTDFDVDQFLQFPADGGKASNDELLSGMFGSTENGSGQNVDDIKMEIEASA